MIKRTFKVARALLLIWVLNDITTAHILLASIPYSIVNQMNHIWNALLILYEICDAVYSLPTRESIPRNSNQCVSDIVMINFDKSHNLCNFKFLWVLIVSDPWLCLEVLCLNLLLTFYVISHEIFHWIKNSVWFLDIMQSLAWRLGVLSKLRLGNRGERWNA